MFLTKVEAKLSLVVDNTKEKKTKGKKAAKPSKTKEATVAIKGKPGDVFEVVEGANPHKGDAEETVVITIIGNDRHGNGFYYFQGDGKPKHSGGMRGGPQHSNMFVWGVVSAKKIGSHPFKLNKYKKYKWSHTGIPLIDMQMANLDDRYTLFTKEAPEEFQKLYDEQQDNNHHNENAKMVDAFAGWMSSGKKAADFNLKGKEKAK